MLNPSPPSAPQAARNKIVAIGQSTSVFSSASCAESTSSNGGGDVNESILVCGKMTIAIIKTALTQ
jgi:hypothetical protein